MEFWATLDISLPLSIVKSGPAEVLPRLLLLLLGASLCDVSAQVTVTHNLRLAEVKLAVQELQVRWPDWATQALEPSSKPRYLLWCNCRFTQLPAPLPMPDPVALLAAGYLEASHVEIWRLERSVETAAAPHLWADANHRGVAISSSAQESAPRKLREWFWRLADILTASDSSADHDYLYDPLATSEDVVEWLKFVPDLVLTFHGPQMVRVEFDLESRLALLQSGDAWAMYALTNEDRTALTEGAERR